MSKTVGSPEVLASFINFTAAMNSWETRNYNIICPLMESGNAAMTELQQAKRELAEIFDQYLEPKHGDRRRLDACAISAPATYDPQRDQIKVVASTDREATIEYKQLAEPKSMLRFVLKNIGEKWLIHKAQHFDEVRKRWEWFII